MDDVATSDRRSLVKMLFLYTPLNDLKLDQL